jgi:predicted DNA-binding transcriptional regulator AlpA
MPRQAALPSTLAPRLVTREAAAAYACVSPTTFDNMVRDGRMPPPKCLGERRFAWDVRALDAAVDSLPDKLTLAPDDSWDDVNAAQAPSTR